MIIIIILIKKHNVGDEVYIQNYNYDNIINNNNDNNNSKQ